MNLDTRLLKLSDLDQLRQLLSSRTRLLGTPISREQASAQADLSLSRWAAGQSNFAGSFLDGTLVSCIGQAFWSHSLTWTLFGLTVKSGSTFFNLKKNGIEASFNLLSDQAEARWYYTYYYAIKLRDPSSKKIKRIRQNYLADRYDYFIETIIPAGTLPAMERYRILLGNRAWKVNAIIQVGQLKNEHRKFTTAEKPYKVTEN